jgi:hypothetical protein
MFTTVGAQSEDRSKNARKSSWRRMFVDKGTKTNQVEIFKQSIIEVSAANDADVVAFTGSIDSTSDQELIAQIKTFCTKPNIFCS